MRRFLATLTRLLPPALSLLLLAWQISIPWMPRYFVTQDGPSHLYGAAVLRGLLWDHAHSIYSAWYTIQRTPLPNWMASILLALAQSIGGADHAERLFASLAILAGYLAIAYAIRAISPGELPLTPVSNFLLQTWFLCMGFYNFYLGMALMPFAVGYYATWQRRFTPLRAAVLAAMLFVLFATHLIAAAVAVMAMAILALWNALWNREPGRLRGLLLAGATALPVCVLTLWYALSLRAAAPEAAGALTAWRQFPMHVFVTASGPDGSQRLSWKIFFAYAIVAALLLRKAEWRSPRGALVIAAFAAFLLYLFAPGSGLGGGFVKIRFSWAMFLLAGIAAGYTSRLRWAQIPVAFCFTWLLAGNFLASAQVLHQISEAAGEYLSIAGRIPSRAIFVRLRYPTPDAPERFGYRDAARDPLMHLDAFVAASRPAVDLSDYEAPTRTFPIIFKPKVDPGQQSNLAAFEGPDPGSLKALTWLNEGLPKPIDYVLVVGDVQAADAVRENMPAMLDYLDRDWQAVAVSREGWFRLYRSKRAPPDAGAAPTAQTHRAAAASRETSRFHPPPAVPRSVTLSAPSVRAPRPAWLRDRWSPASASWLPPR